MWIEGQKSILDHFWAHQLENCNIGDASLEKILMAMDGLHNKKNRSFNI